MKPSSIIVTALLVSVLSASGAYASVYSDLVMSKSPEVYYRFDESAGASSATSVGMAAGFNANAVNTTTFGVASFNAAQLGTAVDLTTNGYFLIPGNVNHYTQFLNNQPVTLEYWINTTSTSNGGNQGWNNPQLIGEDNGGCCGAGSVDQFWGVMKDGRVGIKTQQNGNGAFDYVALSGTAVNDGNWHHIAITRDALNATTIYVDGQFEAIGTITVTPSNGINHLGVGEISQISNTHLNAQIDEVAIYSSVLTAQDVFDHFTAAGGSAPPPPLASPIAFAPSSNPPNIGAVGTAMYTFNLDASTQDLSTVLLQINVGELDEGYQLKVNGTVILDIHRFDTQGGPVGVTPGLVAPWNDDNVRPRTIATLTPTSVDLMGLINANDPNYVTLTPDMAATIPVFVDGQNVIMLTNYNDGGGGGGLRAISLFGTVDPLGAGGADVPEPATATLALLSLGAFAIRRRTRRA